MSPRWVTNGHPSSEPVFSDPLVPGIDSALTGADQAPKLIAPTVAVVAISAIAAVAAVAAAPMIRVLRMSFLPDQVAHDRPQPRYPSKNRRGSVLFPFAIRRIFRAMLRLRR